ncbi:hypothetical protein LOC68_14615 [Blastopirellula sp. JC732]|uniref:Uncharacterized protein n=1 Tax=Blastopirellula sediminis TaxID=2894196 RepID=A0A9X1SGQ4_9BACT|nr:hypothetical protein [Blastopirellula sediminis]MCC9607084.1 hypothetical protein [Blastopirellula sediminis]MCC9629623.1 hypothetical protein [Blastopirellula sediminis]
MRLRPLLTSLVIASVMLVSTGCLSLSLGGRTCTGNSPETMARIAALEQRVNALEQMLPPPVEMVMTPAGR